MRAWLNRLNVRPAVVVFTMGCLIGCTVRPPALMNNNTNVNGGSTNSNDNMAPDDDIPPGELTADQGVAVDAVVNAMGAMAQATGASEGATASGDDSANQLVPGGVTVGVCPEVTASRTGDTAAEFDVTISFGDGCEAFGATDFVCSGSAAGAFDTVRKSISLNFDELSCQDITVNGTVSASYEASQVEFAITGQWDLTRTNGDGSLAVVGVGTAVYSRVESTARVATFGASVTTGDDSWRISVTDVAMSAAQFGNLIPFSGTIDLTGDTIPSMMLRFDTDSPTTGVIQVSIAGGPYFTVDIDNL